jgi:hypothetical protein
MGYLSALDMAAQADIEIALSWHLASNHYPPVPSSMIEPCKAAIEAVMDGREDELIPLPVGVLYRSDDVAPAWALVEGLHLDAFLDVEVDYEP